MKNKKFLIAMLSACFLASCAFGVACKDKNDGPIDSSSKSAIDNPNCTQRRRNKGVVISRSVGRSFF